MLIPETGSGSPSANSYASVSQADTYFLSRNVSTWATYSTADKEAALINATDFIEATYSESFKGFRLTQTQALSWPRSDVVVDDFLLPQNAIPVRLINATIQMALRAATGEPLIADQTQRVVKEKVDVVEVEYAEYSDPQQRYPAVTRTLTPILKATGDASFSQAGLVRV